MKILLSLFLISAPAFAADLNVISLEVLPGAKVKSVACEKLSHINHDEALAGTAVVVSAEGQELKMNLIISRFSNEKADAAALCKQLQAAAKSGKPHEVVYDRSEDREGKERLDIKGAVKLSGLNPFNNG